MIILQFAELVVVLGASSKRDDWNRLKKHMKIYFEDADA
jgi:hypothetical protein